MANAAGWHHEGLSIGGGDADPEWTVPRDGVCLLSQPGLQLFVCAETWFEGSDGGGIWWWCAHPSVPCRLTVQDPVAWACAIADCVAVYGVHVALR